MSAASLASGLVSSLLEADNGPLGEVGDTCLAPKPGEATFEKPKPNLSSGLVGGTFVGVSAPELADKVDEADEADDGGDLSGTVEKAVILAPRLSLSPLLGGDGV